MMISPASLGVYVINLDRCVARWSSISTKALDFGIPILRVPAIDGRAIDPKDYVDVNQAGFLKNCGRLLLPGEYGCYRSHLRAMATFLASRFDAAIIVEDDIELTGDLIERTCQILSTVQDADVVKLFNHRSRGFRRIAVTPAGDEIGRCLHGPQGSAACYAVTRRGARKIAAGMQRMLFPFDIALERGWFYGANILTVKENLVSLGAHCVDTQIGKRADYRAIKFNGARRWPTHLRRILDYSRRIRYALTTVRG